MHINAAVTYAGADVREDQKVGRQMLRANRAAPDWAKATRHSTALKTRSGGSNCSNGVIYTVDLRLPCCLAELTGTQSITDPAELCKCDPSVILCFHLLLIHKQQTSRVVPEFYMFAVEANMLGWACGSLFEFKGCLIKFWDHKNRSWRYLRCTKSGAVVLS